MIYISEVLTVLFLAVTKVSRICGQYVITKVVSHNVSALKMSQKYTLQFLRVFDDDNIDDDEDHIRLRKCQLPTEIGKFQPAPSKLHNYTSWMEEL